MKRIMAIWMALMLISSPARAAGSLTASPIENYETPVTTAAISIDDAKQIALDHAQLTLDQVQFLKDRPEREDGRLVYDIEFMHGYAEYDYEIDPMTGEILSFDNEGEYIGDSVDIVDAEGALHIALAQAGLKQEEVRVLKTELDYDDGMRIYEIEFLHGRVEYECDIDASTGRIIEWDRDD